MTIVARNEGFFALDPADANEAGARAQSSRDWTLSLTCSALLHGLVLALLLLLAPNYGTETTGKDLGLVPVEVELDWNRAARTETPTHPALAPSGGAPEASFPVADALASKLEALAKLRAPGAGASSEEEGSRPANIVAVKRLVAGTEGHVWLEGLHPRSGRAPLELEPGKSERR